MSLIDVLIAVYVIIDQQIPKIEAIAQTLANIPKETKKIPEFLPPDHSQQSPPEREEIGFPLVPFDRMHRQPRQFDYGAEGDVVR